MAHFTITPLNSVHSMTTARTMANGNGLTILSGGYLAGNQIGLALTGDNNVLVRGEVSGDTAITVTQSATIAVARGGAILGGEHALTGAGYINLSNWGEILTVSDSTLPAIIVTGGPAFKLENYGLIGTTQGITQSGHANLMDLTTDRFYLTNSGTILGQIKAQTTRTCMIDNSGSIASLYLNLGVGSDTYNAITNTGSIGESYLLGGGSLTNSGEMGYLYLDGGWNIFTPGGKIAGIWGTVGGLSLTGQNAEFGSINIEVTREGFNSGLWMYNLQGSQFQGITVNAGASGAAMLDLAGTTVVDIDVSGNVDVRLDGASVGWIHAKDADIDASGVTSPLSAIWLDTGDERLVASAFADQVLDMGGNDRIDLGGGDDIYGAEPDTTRPMGPWGGPQSEGGADSIEGGAGIDTYVASYDVPILADLRAHTVTERIAGGPVDEVWGIEAVTGSFFADILRGDGEDNMLHGGYGGDDTLAGRGGDDTLAGGNGHNRLHGGAGADVFVGSRGGDDVILDFKTGRDRIDLSSFDLDSTTVEHEALTWGKGPGQADLQLKGDGGHLVVRWTDGAEILAMDIHGTVNQADFIL